MDKYISRLKKCGYTYDKAKQICIDFTKNLTLFDLECFVWAMEKKCG